MVEIFRDGLEAGEESTDRILILKVTLPTLQRNHPRGHLLVM